MTATIDRNRTAASNGNGAVLAPELRLQDELEDDRVIGMRADAGAAFLENLEIPNHGDLWIPGYKLVTSALAQEVGLRGFEDDPFEDLPLDEPQPASGAIDGNIIASFVDGVSGQQKNDVLNACLLAQLAANAKFRRETQPVEWTQFYSRVLENIGWVVPSFQFRGLRTSQARFTMDAVIIRLLTGLLSGAEMETVQAAIDAVKALEADDRRFVIFERNSTRTNVGNFQVDNVGVSATGVLSMKLGAFSFDTNTTVTNVLWFSFSGNATSMKVSKTTMVLNEQVYERIRDAVVNKLGARAADFIGGLELEI